MVAVRAIPRVGRAREAYAKLRARGMPGLLAAEVVDALERHRGRFERQVALMQATPGAHILEAGELLSALGY